MERLMNSFNNRPTANGAKPLNQQLAEQLRQLEEKEDKQYQAQPYLKDPLPGTADASSFRWPDKFTPDQRILFGMGIKDARNKCGYSQNSLARLCNIDSQIITRLEAGGIAKVDKVLIKKIGHILRDDFNELMMSVCNDKPAVTSTPVAPGVVRVTNGLCAIAQPPTLEFAEEQTYKLKGHNFELKGNVGANTFKLSIIVNNKEEVIIYEGNKDKNHLFLQAMDKIVEKIKKGI